MAHQLQELEVSKDLPIRAILWEQGTGKTKLAIDTAAHLFRTGKITGLFVLAPNGVHSNWILDEIPTHMPDDARALARAYSTDRSATKAHKAAMEEVVTYAGGLAVLTMSYHAFRTLRGRQTAERFLRERRCLYVLDESQRIKTPGTKRTISVVCTGRRALYKRILTGTPITNKPFDIYSQLKFLSEDFWKRHGFSSYEAFKTFFGIWVERINNSTGGRFLQVTSFQNLETLAEILSTVSSRVLKDQVLDLPPKVYQKRYFELSAAQAAAYKAIRTEFIAELDSGAFVTATLMVTRLLRFQQIACGYLPEDGTGKLIRFPENPRLDLLCEVVEDLEGSAIIFARFKADIDQIIERLDAAGHSHVRYDGRVGEEERVEARRSFQAGQARFFVANPAAAATGLTLHRAQTVIYYSNSFDLEHRIQSEDRAHRMGQTKTVTYIDLMGQGTIDHKLVSSLRQKISTASLITRDKIRAWI